MKPENFLDPEWEKADRKPHDWRNYISQDLRDIWMSFSYTQKLKIAENAEQIADREEWE